MTADKKRLMTLLCEAHNISCEAKLFDDATYAQQLGKEAEHLLANGVTFQKWIPVSERLPEDDLPKDSKRKSIKVLVTYKTPTGIPVVRTQVREKEPWYGHKGWDWTKSGPITHWMPLPEPPQEG